MPFFERLKNQMKDDAHAIYSIGYFGNVGFDKNCVCFYAKENFPRTFASACLQFATDLIICFERSFDLPSF